MRDYWRLIRFALPYSGLFVLAFICIAFSALFDGVSLAMIVPLADKVLTNKQIIVPVKLPSFLAVLVERINGTPPAVLLSLMAVAVLVLFFLKGLFGFLQGYLMSDIAQRVVRDIRLKLYKKIQFLSLDYLTQKRTGELISRLTNDVGLVENAVSYGATDMFYESMQVALFTCLVFYINFRLALVTLILLPLISLPILKVGKVLRKISRRSQERMADINSLLFETIVGSRIVRAFNMEEQEIQRFRRTNHDYYKLAMKSIKRKLLLSPATEFLGALAGVFVFYWGGKEVIAGKISFGVFGLFLGSLLSLLRPFKKLSQVHSINQQALAATQRIYEILDASVTVKEIDNPIAFKGLEDSIQFVDVWFSYPGNEVLKGINLRVKKGEVVAIVGPSGTGKTTLVDLIPRFYDPQQGSILFDGIDIRRFSLRSLRDKIGIVTQETVLFHDTVRANIAYARPSATEKEIEKVARQAYAHDFIVKLPQGYDTIIGDRGTKLSGGERQRIAIARALLKDPQILILDEATSQLDAESERLVQEALEKLMQGRTVFIIAHRLSAIRNVNRIVVLYQGKIIEEGTHTQLINKKDGLYYRLCQNQLML